MTHADPDIKGLQVAVTSLAALLDVDMVLIETSPLRLHGNTLFFAFAPS